MIIISHKPLSEVKAKTDPVKSLENSITDLEIRSEEREAQIAEILEKLDGLTK